MDEGGAQAGQVELRWGARFGWGGGNGGEGGCGGKAWGWGREQGAGKQGEGQVLDVTCGGRRQLDVPG